LTFRSRTRGNCGRDHLGGRRVENDFKRRLRGKRRNERGTDSSGDDRYPTHDKKNQNDTEQISCIPLPVITVSAVHIPYIIVHRFEG
jgi:hypothetical protein